MTRTYHHGDKAKKRVFGDKWRWFDLNPSDWNREFHTKPKRAQSRELISAVMKGEPDQVWPLGNRKPHIYYY